MVFSNGTAQKANLDHHGLFSFATLWSSINVAAGSERSGGSQAFVSEGSPEWGMSAAALTTYYNIWSGQG